MEHLASPRAPRWLAAATAALAVGTALLVLLGPLASGVLRYRVAPLLEHQLIGSDTVSLGLLVPLGLVAAWLVHRRSTVGPLLALGPAAATWYLVAELVLGPDRGRPGNDELFLPLFLALLLLATAVGAGAWRALPLRRLAFDRPTRTVLGVALLLLVALLVLGRYVPAWLAIVADRPPADYRAGPQVWWTVAFEDLAMLFPALAVTGAGLLRRRPWAGAAAYASSGCLALIGVVVAGMAWSSALHGDPGATAGTAGTMTVVALISAAPAVVCWLALARSHRHVLGDIAAVPAPPAAPAEPLARSA